MRRVPWLIVVGLVVACVTGALAQTSASDEDVARRQLESGREFIRQGNHTEALRDFRAVADTHGSSSVADNALLEIARYYLDTASDPTEAAAAVEAILTNYATSDSAPDAYLIAGRLALAHSRQGEDLDAALANFERVLRLFPDSEAVPRALSLASETHWYAGRHSAALANLARVVLDYSSDDAAPAAYLAAGRVLLALGDPIAAMEELQQVRNRWPDSPEAATALGRITLLHRLYARAADGPVYVPATDAVGPARIDDGVAIAVTGDGAVYWASESSVGAVTPADAVPAPRGGRPRGLALDTARNHVVFEENTLRPLTGPAMPLAVTRPNGSVEALKRADAVVQASNGDWLVMDGDDRMIQRFSRAGAYVGPFAPSRARRLAISVLDEVAALDRNERNVVLYDADANVTGRIPLRDTAYDLRDAEDLAYDAFGHLYVLDRTALAVFSPHPVPASATVAPTADGAGGSYRLLALFSPPENSPGAFRRATALAVDDAGAVYLYDDRARRVLVYR